MKHTKFSKLVSAVMVVAMIMLSAITSYAAPSVTAEQDITKTEITVSGITEDFDKAGIAIVLLAPNVTKEQVDAMIAAGTWDQTKVVDLGQSFVDEDGKYTYTFKLADDAAYGEYKVVATANDTAETTVYFATPTDRAGALKKILEATADSVVVETINNEAQSLGVDNALWELLKTDAAKNDAADAIRANKVLDKIDSANIKPEDIAAAAEQINLEIFTAALNAKAITDLSQYKDYVDEDTYKIFDGFTDSEKAAYLGYISGKDFDSAEDLAEDALIKAEIVAVTSDNTEMTDVQQYMEDMKLSSASDFKGLSALQKRNVIAEVKSKAPQTVAALDSALKTAVAKYQSSGTGSGTGGGTGSGSKPSTIVSGGNSSDTDSDNNKEPAIKYIDLAGYEWAEEAIYDLSEKNILAGYGDGIFNPSNQIKRSEFAKVVVSAMYGEEAINADVVPTFTDAKSGWYTPYIGYAEKQGIIKGISETEFGTENLIRRQDIMTILYRIMLANGYQANTTAIAYGDAAQIADYAKDAVFALANAGIVKGYEDGSIRPTGYATRAEVAVMVSNFIKMF